MAFFGGAQDFEQALCDTRGFEQAAGRGRALWHRKTLLTDAGRRYANSDKHSLMGESNSQHSGFESEVYC